MKKILIIGLLLITSQAFALSPAMLGSMGNGCAGQITSVAVANSGDGYSQNDILLLDEGTNGKVIVDIEAICVGGGCMGYTEEECILAEPDCTWDQTRPVSAATVYSPGCDYEVSTKPTSGGTGLGATIEITGVE